MIIKWLLLLLEKFNLKLLKIFCLHSHISFDPLLAEEPTLPPKEIKCPLNAVIAWPNLGVGLYLLFTKNNY